MKVSKMYVGKQESQVHFNGNNTIKDLLEAPKDRDSITNKGGIIYRYKSDYLGCTMGTLVKLVEPLGTDKRNILELPLIYDHANTTGHCIKLCSFSIVDRESKGSTRTIKEAMFIRVNDPLNRNLSKYQPPHI